MPPADLIPCGGSVGALLVVLLLRFVMGAGWWFFVAFLRQCVTENIHASTAYIKIAMAIKKIRRATS